VTTIQQTTELEWIEMAGPRGWARVYQLIAETSCTLEHAIQAVQATDKDMPNETSRPDTDCTNLRGDYHRISY
jgi:hypothetical protein